MFNGGEGNPNLNKKFLKMFFLTISNPLIKFDINWYFEVKRGSNNNKDQIL